MPDPIKKLVLFGATGDLAGRFLLPGLGRLRAVGELPDDLLVVGAALKDWDDRTFQRYAAKHLERHAGDVPSAVREALLRSLRYRTVDFGDPRTVARVVGGDDGAEHEPVAAYLA